MSIGESERAFADAENSEAAHLMCIINATGDSRVEWNRSVQAEVNSARAMFDSMVSKSYVAYKMRRDGSRGEVIHAFDPDAERIILAPPQVGG